MPAGGVTKAAVLKNAFFVANLLASCGQGWIADDVGPVVTGSIKVCIYSRGDVEWLTGPQGCDAVDLPATQ